MCSARSWHNVPFHAVEYPSIAWFPKDSLTDPVEPLQLEDATEEARGRGRATEEEEPEVPDVDLEAEVVAIREMERKAGREEGAREADARYAEALDTFRTRIDGVVAAMRRGLDRAEADADRDAVRLGIQLAEHILRTKLVDDPDLVSSTLQTAVEDMPSPEPLGITCSPAQARLLRDNLSAVQEGLGTAALQLEVDDGLEDGDFLLRRGHQTVDGRLAPRLERLRHRLFEALGLDTVVSDAEEGTA